MRNLRKLQKSRAGDFVGLSWRELVKLASSRGLYRVGMTRADVVQVLS